MLKTFLILAALLYLGLVLFALLASDRQIFLPARASYSVGELPLPLVPTRDGAQVAVLHLPNPDGEFTLLFSHGNAEDLGYAAPFLRQLHAAGFAVLAYDYRGYGASTGGPPGAEATYRDIEAVYRHATGELRIPPSRLILYGRSVGSGPATHLAAREPVAGLVIESGFTSAFRVVTQVPILPFDKFPNLKNLGRVRCPVLVIHGTEDEVIPFRHGQLLYAAAPDPKRFFAVRGAHHNDVLLVAGPAYWRALRDFAALVNDHTSALRP